MKIKHKYLRNRHVRNKYWNRVRSRNHPFETIMPWVPWSIYPTYSSEEQIKSHFENITKEARDLDSGHRRPFFRNASSEYRRMINKQRKAQERHALARIRNGDYEYEVPRFKNDAAWLY